MNDKPDRKNSFVPPEITGDGVSYPSDRARERVEIETGEIVVTTNMPCTCFLDGHAGGKIDNENGLNLTVKDIPYGSHVIMAEEGIYRAEFPFSLTEPLVKLNMELTARTGVLYTKSDVGPYKLMIGGTDYDCPMVIRNLPLNEYHAVISYKDFSIPTKIVLQSDHNTTFNLTQEMLHHHQVHVEEVYRKLMSAPIKDTLEGKIEFQGKLKRLLSTIGGTLHDEILQDIERLNAEIETMNNERKRLEDKREWKSCLITGAIILSFAVLIIVFGLISNHEGKERLHPALGTPTPVTTWSKNYGGAEDDEARSIQQTSDGGYVVAGRSDSFTHGGRDFLIYKLDANGNKVWRKNYGGAGWDDANSIQQTSDGGYVVAGESNSFTHGCHDFLIYKLDANGNKVWGKNYGGQEDDEAWSIQQTSDGGYVVAGHSGSFTHGGYDFLIYKLDANGNKVWRKNYGGAGWDEANSIQQTSDGGYVVAGESNSFTHGGYDFLVYKLDANGNKVWRKNYGGADNDFAWSIQQTSDGGYVVAGKSFSFTHGSADFLIYKLNANGNQVWRKNYGGAGWDDANSIQQTSDGGYVVAGSSEPFTYGDWDFLIYKLDANGNKAWGKNYGDAGWYFAWSIQQTSDGGYVVAGESNSFTSRDYDFLIYKLDSNGNM